MKCQVLMRDWSATKRAALVPPSRRSSACGSTPLSVAELPTSATRNPGARTRVSAPASYVAKRRKSFERGKTTQRVRASTASAASSRAARTSRRSELEVDERMGRAGVEEGDHGQEVAVAEGLHCPGRAPEAIEAPLALEEHL